MTRRSRCLIAVVSLAAAAAVLLSCRLRADRNRMRGTLFLADFANPMAVYLENTNAKPRRYRTALMITAGAAAAVYVNPSPPSRPRTPGTGALFQSA